MLCPKGHVLPFFLIPLPRSSQQSCMPDSRICLRSYIVPTPFLLTQTMFSLLWRDAKGQHHKPAQECSCCDTLPLIMHTPNIAL